MPTRAKAAFISVRGNLINWLRKRWQRRIIDQTMRQFGSIFNFAVYGLILDTFSDLASPTFLLCAVRADAQHVFRYAIM